MIVENKKVKGATLCEYDGIKFKSKLEMRMYSILKEEGFNPEYEQHTFHLWEGKKFSTPCYDLHTDKKLHKKVWGLNTYKPVRIRYSPDFILHASDAAGESHMVVIEAKGNVNDVYPYKKKLFLEHLENNYPGSMFFEIHNLKQLRQAISIINDLKTEQHVYEAN